MRKRGVRGTLVAHSARELSTGETMHRLGFDWKGDLNRQMTSMGIMPPLGDVETDQETVDVIADYIHVRLEEIAERKAREKAERDASE